MQKKAADELGAVERHGPEAVAAFDPVVLPFERHARVVEGNEPGIRDRDAMGVARKIGENRFRSGEWPLGVEDPFGAAQGCEGGVEGALVGKGREIAAEGEPPAACRASSPSRKSRRNRRESTRTGRKKPGLQAIQRDLSGDRPPPGTMTWMCG